MLASYWLSYCFHFRLLFFRDLKDLFMKCFAFIVFWHFPQNYPLYIRSVPSQNELKFHYTVHTSLDVVEEKVSAVGKSIGDQRELYLGLLYPTEDYKVYPLLLNPSNYEWTYHYWLYFEEKTFSSLKVLCFGAFFVSLTGGNRYGYVTNSKVKFVIVVDSSNTSLRDNEIRSVSVSFLLLFSYRT